MSSYKITTDVFTLPYEENKRVLYAPLLGFVCEVNNDMINFLAKLEKIDDQLLKPQEKNTLTYLIEKGVVNGQKTPEPAIISHKGLLPSKLTLFPTNQCNMRCLYCYALAGEFPAKTMDWEIATSAIDYFISFLKEQKRAIFSLEFHGGGEPLLAWTLVKKIILYAEKLCKQEGIALEVVAGTNGILNEKQLTWILNYFSSLNISFDGLPHVQDYHRPMVNRESSFIHVDKTLQYFDRHNFPYAIRATVSSYNENLLEETVYFILENYKTKLIWLEPVYGCGRNLKNENNLNPDFYKFANNFLKLESICREHGVQLEYSGAQFEKVTHTFCYVGTDNFAVTPDGYLTNCWEVTSKDHPLAELFIFGQILPGGKIKVDQKKIEFLRTMSVENFDYCRDCFAKWHCAGDCVVKLGHEKFHGSRGGARCETNRLLIANRIIQLMGKENYYQQEL